MVLKWSIFKIVSSDPDLHPRWPPSAWQPSWMEVVVTGHNFESILPKDHPCHVCFKLADWFQKRRLLNNFPIGSYVKTMSAEHRTLWQYGIWIVTYTCRCIQHADILKRTYLCQVSDTGSPSMSAEGGHLGWRSGSLDTILKIDHLRTIHAMFALNWLTGFRGEDF
jgi:hypothetical protein